MKLLRATLADTTVVWLSCLASFAIGMTFIFVWAPHPWGWEGFDRYHDYAKARTWRGISDDRRALGLSLFSRPVLPGIRGSPLGSAARAGGAERVRPAPELCEFARHEFDSRIASSRRYWTGFCSFNTVYVDGIVRCRLQVSSRPSSYVRARGDGTTTGDGWR